MGLRLSRREEILAYFVDACSGRIGRTQLVKLMYMADFVSYRYLGRSLSEFHWTKENFGPFDDEFYRTKESLEAHGLLDEETRRSARGEEWHRCHITGPLPELSFSAGELAILNHVVKEYAKLPREYLVNEVVYKTPPFRAVRDEALGTPIPLDTVANEGRDAVDGLDLEDIERGRDELRAGRGVPLGDAMNALRGSR